MGEIFSPDLKTDAIPSPCFPSLHRDPQLVNAAAQRGHPPSIARPLVVLFWRFDDPMRAEVYRWNVVLAGGSSAECTIPPIDLRDVTRVGLTL